MPWLDGVKLSDKEVNDWMDRCRLEESQKGGGMSRQFYAPSEAQDLGKFLGEYILARAKAQGFEPTKQQLDELRKELVKTVDEVLK